MLTLRPLSNSRSPRTTQPVSDAGSEWFSQEQGNGPAPTARGRTGGPGIARVPTRPEQSSSRDRGLRELPA